MSQNLKAFLQEETCYTAEEFVAILAEQIPGRSAGDRYVMEAKVAAPGVLHMEMDDGCVFQMTCKKLNN